MEQQILKLLQSGVDENIDLALQLIEGQGLQNSFEDRYKELLTHCKCSLKELFAETDLRIIGKSLSKFPENLCDLVHLKTLYLTHNQITEFPIEFGDLVNLEWLSLTTNQLTKLPKEFGKLSNLKTLFVSYNQLDQLPSELFELANLQRLFLGNNQLTKIPSEVSNFPKLEVLNLYDNPLKPKDINELKKLLPNCEIKF